jgi:hypothetical protein
MNMPMAAHKAMSEKILKLENDVYERDEIIKAIMAHLDAEMSQCVKCAHIYPRADYHMDDNLKAWIKLHITDG